LPSPVNVCVVRRRVGRSATVCEPNAHTWPFT
jgi:hypothetical protein